MVDVNLIKEGIKKKLEDISYSLYSIKSFNDKSGSVLEIIVDRDENIDLDDIVEVSNYLSEYLDEVIMDDNPYTLDVSSLGAEKPVDLEKLDKYQGKYVNLHLSHPYKGENIIEGDLKEVTSDYVVLTYRIKTRIVEAKIERKDIDKARLAIKF